MRISGLPVDAAFEQPINTAGGGFDLRSMDETVQDVLGWGNASADYYEGDAAAQAMPNGSSLERLPGGTGWKYQ